MPTLLIRNLPEHVRDGLRRLAEGRRLSVESLAREALDEFVRAQRPGGVDAATLAAARDALALAPWPVWDDALDDPALSRKALGLEP